MAFNRDTTDMVEILVEKFKYNGVPSFPLNKIRRKYRNLFIKMINSGEIALEEVGVCPCGNDKFVNISGQDRFGLPFRNMLCCECGLLITNPRIAAGSLENYYKDIYHPLVVGLEKGEVADFLVSEHQGEQIYAWCESFILNSGMASLKVFEVGCAGGANLIDFAKKAKEKGIHCELFGSEYEEDNARVASQKGIGIISGGLEAVIQGGLKFDVIILSHVFEHVIDIKLFLNQVRRILSTGGFVYIEVPGVMNKEIMEKWYNNDFLDYAVHAHMYNFSLASMEYICGLNGFGMMKGDEFVRAVFKYDPEKSHGLLSPKWNTDNVIKSLNAYCAEKSGDCKSFARRIKDAIIFIYYSLVQAKVDHSRFYN